MKLARRFGLSLAALVAVTAVANAEGMFSKLPVVSGAAYCALYAGDGVTCAGTVPAGPTALTGNELFPADTKLPGGVQPQTVNVRPATLNAGPTQYSAPLTGASINVLPTTRQVVVEPAGTIAALTLVMPAASGLVDNQRFGFCSTQIVTTLTITDGSGATVQGKPTAAVVPVTTGGASCPEWVYVAAQTKWYRVQ